MTRFLITGGAGFIGSHIAEQIVEKGLGEVVILDNLVSGYERNISHLGGGVTFVNGDTREPRDVERACVGIDFIFHEAAFVSAFDSYNKPELTEEINVGGTRNVLDAALKKGVRRVVLASSAALYGTKSELPNSEVMEPKPESPYARSKLQNEEDARAYAERGIETVCLRYFNVFGPRQDPGSEYSGVISRFVDRISAGHRPTIYGDGTQTRDFIFAGDVARANLIAATCKKCGSGEAINIGTGVERNLLELVDALKAVYGSDVAVEFKPWREGDIRRSVADVALARELLDFAAEVDFRTGIERLVASLDTPKV